MNADATCWDTAGCMAGGVAAGKRHPCPHSPHSIPIFAHPLPLSRVLSHLRPNRSALTKELYKQHISTIVNRVNTITGVAYRDDPTIMGWDVLNEPR